MKHHETDDDFREQICAWFRANGVDPTTVPMNPDASIANGELTFRRKVRREGHDIILNGELVTEVVTVPVVVEPAVDVAEWLRPKCPACGR